MDVAFAMARLLEQPAMSKITTAHQGLDKLLREHGYAGAADKIAGVIHRDLPSDAWSIEMLAGNYLPEGAYTSLTGAAPTVTRGGAAVEFVLAIMEELKINYTEEAIIKAMGRYRMAGRMKIRGRKLA